MIYIPTWIVYLYLTVAGLGIMSMPSFGVWFKANYVIESYKLRRRRDDDWDSFRLEEANWWKLNIFGDYKTHSDDMSLPPAVFTILLFWPIALGLFIGIKGLRYGTRALALPGKALVKLTANKKEKDKYLVEGNREVEKLLLDMHEHVG